MIVLELAESFLPRECSGAERDGWGDDRGLNAKRRKGRKNRIDDGKADAGGRRAEGWPTEHTEHTEGFLTGGNGEGGGRMGRSVHPWLINLECWAAADSRLKDLP